MNLIYTAPGSQEGLVRHLVAYSGMSRERAERVASETFHGGPRFRVPVAPRSDWPPINEKALRIVRYRTRRLEQAINLAYPLLEGEEPVGEGCFASFLADDYLDYPRGTVVVRRTTTLGEIVFVSPEWIIAEAGEIHDARARVAMPEPPAAGGAAAIAWGALAANIGKSLLGSVASQIGSAIFAKLFPPGVPSYFDEVYLQFERIVKKALGAQKKAELRAQVAAIQDGMITYNTLKKDPAKHAEAQRILSDVWNESRFVTNELIQFAEIGLGLFAVAGGLHLAIVQEKALTDDDHGDPNDSPWAEDLIRKAGEFAPFAVSTRNELITTRSNAISAVRFVQKSNFIPGAGPVDASYWTWSDTVLGDVHKYPARRGCCDGDPETTARNERQARFDATVGVMTAELAPVVPAAADWTRVGEDPIPSG